MHYYYLLCQMANKKNTLSCKLEMDACGSCLTHKGALLLSQPLMIMVKCMMMVNGIISKYHVLLIMDQWQLTDYTLVSARRFYTLPNWKFNMDTIPCVRSMGKLSIVNSEHKMMTILISVWFVTDWAITLIQQNMNIFRTLWFLLRSVLGAENTKLTVARGYKHCQIFYQICPKLTYFFLHVVVVTESIGKSSILYYLK